MTSLSNVFKAYDIRGIVPDELNALQFRAIGVAVARFADAPTILIARDMRDSGVELAEAFALGARSEGASIVDLGLASTDLLYYAAGSLDAPGAMFTASHNPAKYNGLKLCLSGAGDPVDLPRRVQGLAVVRGAPRPAGAHQGGRRIGARHLSLIHI